MLMNITQYPYDVMTMYGSMQLNDLGSFKECRKMDASDYALVSLNISHSPLTLFFASCLPKECQQDDYTVVTNTLSAFITNLLVPILAGPVDTPGEFHNWTKIVIEFRKTDEVMQEWKEGSRAGFISFIALATVMLAVVSCLPSIYHITVRKLHPQKVFNGQLV